MSKYTATFYILIYIYFMCIISVANDNAELHQQPVELNLDEQLQDSRVFCWLTNLGSIIVFGFLVIFAVVIIHAFLGDPYRTTIQDLKQKLNASFTGVGHKDLTPSQTSKSGGDTNNEGVTEVINKIIDEFILILLWHYSSLKTRKSSKDDAKKPQARHASQQPNTRNKCLGFKFRLLECFRGPKEYPDLEGPRSTRSKYDLKRQSQIQEDSVANVKVSPGRLKRRFLSTFATQYTDTDSHNSIDTESVESS